LALSFANKGWPLIPRIRRLMREHDLQPKHRRRFVVMTDSGHNGPIFPDLARDRIVDGPNQLWVADITLALKAHLQETGLSIDDLRRVGHNFDGIAARV
jgi:transposase InsO family protein